MPPDLAALLLMGSGRPLLLAPPAAPQRASGTALLFWKETAASARGLSVALPLLARHKRVVVVGVEESEADTAEGLDDLVRQLAWDGIAAEAHYLRAGPRSPAEQLASTAARHDADLLVMGGYGHSRMREIAFGGCTQHFLRHADRPVLLMH